MRIKELRNERHLSMAQVARDLNIPYTTYVNYEKEAREPNSELLIQLADYYKCSVDYLIGRSNIPCIDTAMEISKLIGDRRKELGLTLEEVGNIVGVSKSTVKKWEDGYISNMKRDKIALLSKALKLNPVVLIMGEDVSHEQDSTFILNDHEKQVILAYRSKPDMQNAVDTLLNVPALIEVKSVARSSDHHKQYNETITAEQLRLFQSQEQLTSDDDL